jgi:outer membrane biosynthesis protein TonB
MSVASRDSHLRESKVATDSAAGEDGRMDRLLAGPPARSARRATFGNDDRAVRAMPSVVAGASPSSASSHAEAARERARFGRAPRNAAIVAAGHCALHDTIQEDFLDKTSMAPAELLRAAETTLTEARSAMPLAMRAATKKAPAKKPAAKKTAAKKPAAKKAAPKKAAAKRTTTARKPAAKKAAPKKAAAKKPAAKKAAPAKKPAAKKAAAKKPAAKKPAARKPRKPATPAPTPAPAEGSM